MSGYALHPEAFADLDEIREYIASDSPGFPVKFGGFDAFHVAFLNESRTRGRFLRSTQEIRGSGRRRPGHEEIFASMRAMVPFPRQGHLRPDLTARPLRFKLVRDYLIAYAPDERPIWVIAVIHGRRSPRVMAAILRARE